jgi:hypothetical protein
MRRRDEAVLTDDPSKAVVVPVLLHIVSLHMLTRRAAIICTMIRDADISIRLLSLTRKEANIYYTVRWMKQSLYGMEILFRPFLSFFFSLGLLQHHCILNKLRLTEHKVKKHKNDPLITKTAPFSFSCSLTTFSASQFLILRFFAGEALLVGLEDQGP